MSKSEIKRVWPDSDHAAQARRAAWATARRAKEKEIPPTVGLRRLARRLFGLRASDGGRPRRYPAYAYVMNRSLEIVRRDVPIRIPDLPAVFEGYRILHLTDLHLDHLPLLAEKLAATLDGLEVDLALISGDYQENQKAAAEEIARLMARALAPLTALDGIFGTLGNHDTVDLVEPLEAAGVRLLVNEVIQIGRGGDSICVTGTDDVHQFYSSATEEALDSGPGGTRIALTHSPEAADVASRRHQLLLCGHTHGGQICLPGGRPLVTGLKRHKEYVRGLWQHNGMTGFTGAGVGTTVIPIRLNCPGEAVVLTLRR